MSKFTKESDIRKQVGKITAIRSKGTDDKACCYNLAEEEEADAEAEFKEKESVDDGNDDDDDEVGCYTVNGIRSGFWSIRENRGRLIKAGLTRREKEGVHLRRGESNDCDDVGLTTISETATIKDTVFREAVHQLQQHQSRTSQQPRVACCYCCDAVHVCEDQQPVYPLTGSGIIDVPGCHHHRSSHPLSSSSSPLTFCQVVNHNQSIFDQNLQIQLTNKTTNQLSTFNLNKCSVGQSPHQTSKRYCDSRFAPHFVSSSSSTETSKTSKTSCTSIPSCSFSFDRFVVDSDYNNKSEVKKVNKLKLTDNQLVKCSHVGSNNDTSVLFSGLVANKRKLFTRLLVKDTIKKVDSNHNKNYKLKQEAINQQPLSSGTQSSSLSLSRFNSGKVDYKERQHHQHQHQLGQCYKSFKMVAETDNHSINGEGMAMTINHSNREMTMFLDNINGHHYENINVYHSNSHNHSHHHPLANGKNLNPVSYLHKDRPNSANSYSLESNSSESNTTDSSGTISSPSSSTDDTHGDELQYGPGIVDKLRSKFLQYSLQTSRNNGYRSVVKRCSSLENLADRDSPSSSPLYHTCKGTNFGTRKGPNYVKYHHQQNNNNPHHCSKQSNHIKSNNSYNGVASDVDINCGGGGGAAVVISNNNNNNRGLINGKTFQSVTSTTSTEKLLQGESRNSCFTASRTPNGYISSSGRNYRKYEQQPIKGNHYHHLNQHSSIYHNHNHRYNCDGLLKRAQSVETLLLESRNCKSGAPSTSTSITFTNSNSNNTVPNNSNLNSTLLTSTVSTVTTTTSSASSSFNSTSNSGSEYCEPLLLPVSNQQSRWQSNNSNNNNNISLASSVVSSNNAFSNKVNCVSQVCNHHLVTKQQDLVDTVTNTCKKMSSDDNNIVNGLPLSECKVKSSIYSPLSSNTDKKMNGDVTSSVTSNNVTCAPTTAINNSNNCNNNNISDLVNHGPRKLVEDELPKPDTVKNYKKIFETNSVSPTPLAGPLSPSSSSSSSSSSATTTTTMTTTSTINTTLPTATNNDHTSTSQNEKDSESRNGQAYRKGGIYGSSNSAIRRKPPVLSSIEKKITNTVNKVTINSNSNSNNNNNTNHSSTRLINGSNTTSSSPTSPALPPKPPFLINKKLPLNGELNHVNVNNNNYLSAIKPVGKQHQISSESNKNKINSGKSVNGSKDNLRPTCNNISSSKSNLVRNKPLPSSLNNIKPKLINKFDEQPPTSRSSSTSSSLSSSPLISPSSFMPPSPLSNGSKKCIEGDLTGNDTMDGCPLITSSSEFNNTLNGPFSPSLDKDDCKESGKPLISQKVISEPKPASSTTTSSMITTNNKPIANIKPIQLESSEDRWKPTISKKSTLPQESLASDSADKQHEKVVFTSMGVTNNNNNHNNNNNNNVIKDQSSHQDYVKTGLPSRVNDKNRLNNHDNQMNANKKMNSETDEKSKIEPSNLNNHNKDSKTATNSPISSNESIKSRSYHTPSPPTNSTSLSSPSSSVSVVNKSSPISGTTMIFDFRGKNVKANVAVYSPPFSVVRPASSTPNSPTRSDNDNEDDYNYTGSTEVPQPSGIIFAGENVIIAGGSLLVKRNKKLTLTFNDKATATFEYPSEACYLEDPLSFSPTTSSISTTSSPVVNGHSDESKSVINQQQSTPTSSSSSSAGSSLKNNTTLGGSFSGGLASYKPTFLAAESVPFQLGVSRAIKEESDSSTSSGSSHGGKSSGADMEEEEESVETSFNMIKPAEPNETTSWSTSSTALDLLF